jgi:hypothetical protein
MIEVLLTQTGSFIGGMFEAKNECFSLDPSFTINKQLGRTDKPHPTSTTPIPLEESIDNHALPIAYWEDGTYDYTS